MKTIYKVALTLIGVGFAFCVMSWELSGGKLEDYSVSFPAAENGVERIYDCNGKVSSVLIEDSSIDIDVEAADIDHAKVSVCESESIKYNISEINGQLSIERKNSPKPFSYNDGSYKVKVYLPRNSEYEIDVSATSSEVTIQHINISKLEVRTTSGDQKIYDAVISKNTEAESTSGDISFSKVEAKGKLNLSTTSGDIKLLNLVCNSDLRAQATSGNMRFTAAEILGNISFEATSGDISGELVGKQSDFSVNFNATSGECNIPNSTGGTRKLTISTTSGDANLTFK